MMESLQESRMRENRKSGSMRGSNGKGIANATAARCSLLYWFYFEFSFL